MFTDTQKFVMRFYLDFANNYATVSLIAEHNGISEDCARAMIVNGRKMHDEFVEMGKGSTAIRQALEELDK
jgi:hypothetical protein